MVILTFFRNGNGVLSWQVNIGKLRTENNEFSIKFLSVSYLQGIQFQYIMESAEQGNTRT